MQIPIPQFQRGVQPNVPGGVPQWRSPAVNGAQDLAQGVGRVADVLQRNEAIRADNDARLAKERADLEAKLADEQKKARNVERASNAQLEWAQTFEDRKTGAKAGAQGFTTEMAKELDAYRKTATEAIPDEAERRQYNEALGRLRENVLLKSMAFESDQSRTYRKQVVSEGIATDAKTAAIDPGQYMDLLAQRLAVINKSADLPAEEKAVLAKHARELLSTSAATTLADRDPAGFLRRIGARPSAVDKKGKPVPINAADAAAMVERDPILSQLPPAQLRAIGDRAATVLVHEQARREAEAERAARRAEAATNKREREANQAYTILSDWARDGKSADPLAAKPLLDKLAGTPYAAAYAARAKDVATNAAAAILPLAEQRARLDALLAKRNAGGTSQALEHEIAASEKILTSSERDYKADPLRAGAERGVIHAVAPLNTASIETMLAGVGPRLEQAAAVATRTRTPVSPLTSDEAVNVKKQLDALPDKERGAAIASIAKTFGRSGAVAVAEQMDKQDKPLALAFKYAADSTPDGQFRSAMVLAGARALKDGTASKDPMKVTGWNATIAKEIDALKLPHQPTSDEFKVAAGYMAAAKAAEKGGFASSSDVRKAVEAAVGGKIVEQGDGTIVLPDGVSHFTLTQRLKAVTVDEIKGQIGARTEYVIAGGAQVPLADFVDSLPGATLVNVGQGRYSVTVGGRPVLGPVAGPDGKLPRIVIGIQ